MHLGQLKTSFIRINVSQIVMGFKVPGFVFQTLG
jgi:hypothetical protein